MKISKKLKKCRLSNSLTQSQVAKILHVSRKTVSGWENGRSYPDVNSFVQLSDLYKVSLDSLLRDDKVLKYYKKQNKRNIQIHKIAKYSYVFNIVMLGLSYIELFRIAGLHSLLIPLFLLINIAIFISHYENWYKFSNNAYRLTVTFSFIIIFGINVLLNLLSSGFVYQMNNNDINFITGMMLGRLILNSLISFSLTIIIFFRDALHNYENIK
ncbi:helix-turn-helix domain-containing protein [Pediococcus cellicola]|uniref:Transcriptional regulator n=1 Tax=Pediococcus cellicola TaxID=319652 RepID=A0A0R2IQI2_9LACO|nr:helix-turn-helix transcriptional regulator [Pediococcus cellicola]KRN67006.1 transcriptional regulator [Pediococcus cellicola]GEL15062.1 transcriptional regulator [Pediococcus cellicola]